MRVDIKGDPDLVVPPPGGEIYVPGFDILAPSERLPAEPEPESPETLRRLKDEVTRFLNLDPDEHRRIINRARLLAGLAIEDTTTNGPADDS
jgi:hypothetical protein